MNPYLGSHQEHCILQDPVSTANDVAIIYFILDLKNKKYVTSNPVGWLFKKCVFCRLKIKCEDQQLVHIYKNKNDVPSVLSVHRQKRQQVADHCSNLDFDITTEVIKGKTYYNASVRKLSETQLVLINNVINIIYKQYKHSRQLIADAKVTLMNIAIFIAVYFNLPICCKIFRKF